MRQPEYSIQPLILNRWSPRAMSGETIEDEELMSLDAIKKEEALNILQPDWYRRRLAANEDQ